MRIVVIGSFIDYQVQMANELSKSHEVLLLFISFKISEDNLKCLDKNVKYHLLGKSNSTYSIKNLQSLYETVSIINEFRPDVIHWQLGGTTIDLALLPFVRKYPIVSTIHDIKQHFGEESWWKDSILKLFIRSSRQIIVHGQTLKSEMINEYKVDGDRVNPIPIGIHNVHPFKLYESADIKEAGNVVLFFGYMAKYKGLDYLIEATPLIKKDVPDCKVILAGPGSYLNDHGKNISPDIMVINQYITYKEGAELLQRCSLVVLPYVEVSQSGVISTAYGFKKPVVVTNVGAMPEIVDDGVTGYVVPSRDTVALADSIIRLLKNDSLRKSMGENGYKKLTTELSWERLGIMTIDVYKKALNI